MATAMRRGLLATLLLVLSTALVGLAQPQDPLQLTIKVTDPSGAAVPNASVTLRKDNEERTFTADATGTVQVPNLPTGEWSLSARGEGFAVKQRPVIMQGVAQSITVILDLAPVRTNVLVEIAQEPPSAVQLHATASGGSYLDVSVKDLPFNLTVINQDYIRERGVTNLMDAVELVSGVTTWTDSGNYIPAADIRGLSTTDAGIFIAENGIVQNSVPQALRNQDSFFLESVEVLKGPSSFSYGSGTAGASINSRAKMPKSELGFDALFTYESFGKTREGFLVTGPLMKNLSGLFGFVHNQGGSHVQNTHYNGRNWDTALTWTPKEWVTFNAQGIYRTDDLGTYFSTPILNSRVDPNVKYIELAANTFLDPRVRSLNYQMTDPDNDTRYRRGTLTTDFELPRGWRLQHRLYGVTLMQDTLTVESLNFNQTTLRVTPGNYFFNFKRDWMHGNEVNVRNAFRFWNGRSIQFTIGGKIERNNQHRHGANNATGTNPAPPSMDYLNPIAYTTTLHRNSMKTAKVDSDYDTGYFEAAFHFMPKFALSGGVRWDHITNTRETYATAVTNRVSFHPVTGRYALTYYLKPNVTLYLGRSHAVQPSGTGANNTGATALVGITQTQAQFSTQPSRGWEGGVKASAWRERIQGGVSYFHMRKHNITTQELVNNVTVIERAGKVKSEGIDTMFMLSPIRMFSLQGDFVWNNGRYLVFKSVANGAEVDRSGNWLPRVPAVQWSVTPIVRLGPVRGSVTVKTRGASWADNNNLNRLAPLTTVASNVSVRLAKGFTLTLTGRNLTDEIVLNRGGLTSGSTTARIGPPRNYSMQIERQW